MAKVKNEVIDQQADADDQVDDAQNAEQADADETAVEGIVKMVRGNEYPEPHTADVHASEVDNYKTQGWTEA